MKKIGIREYSKHFLLDLFPKTNCNEDLNYMATATEVAALEKWIQMLLSLAPTNNTQAEKLRLRAEQFYSHGGPLLSLRTVYIPTCETAPTDLVFLDLNYTVTKEVQFAISGVDMTSKISKSDKHTGLLTRFLKELFQQHEESFGDSSNSRFIQELYLNDDVDMVLDEKNEFKIKVDRSLRDYLLALNTRLRVNA